MLPSKITNKMKNLEFFLLKNKGRRGIMLHLSKILITVFVIWLGSTCFAQQWAVTHSSPFIGDLIGEEKAYSIAAGNDGTAYVTGFSMGELSGFDICTIKYDEFGDTLWVKYYNGSGNSEDKAYAIVVDKDQNVFVVGYTTSDSSGQDIVVLKYNSEGILQWDNTYTGPGIESDKAYAIVLDNFGNVYVGGYMTVTGEGRDFALIKYTSAGDFQWAKTFSGPNNGDDEAFALATLGNDAVVLTGYSSGPLAANENIATVKYDANGNLEWDRYINGSGNESDRAYAIVTDGYNSIYITGYASRTGTGKDIVTAKYDNLGEQIWAVYYDGYTYDDAASALVLASPDVLVVTGKVSKGIDVTSEDFITIKYNTLDGSYPWTKEYDGEADAKDFANAIAVSPDGSSVYVTGVSSEGETLGSEDMYTVKYDVATGDVLDSALYSTGASNSDVAFDIAVDSLENVFITGYTEVIPGDRPVMSKWLTCKYGKGRLSAKNTHSNQPKTFALYQNYPNPFNPSTVIKFDIMAQSLVTLKIYDVLGKEVGTLVNQDLKPGNYTYSFKQTNLSSGIYFYVLTAGSFRDVKKMMIVK